jgi:hypothetical protein
VVFLAGGAGSLLLMQPDSIDAATNKLHMIFIIASSHSIVDRRGYCRFGPGASTAAERASACRQVSYKYAVGASGSRIYRGYTVPAARDYWIYDCPADA